jgi:L-2-hydroxyglutarate oxidase LhgO
MEKVDVIVIGAGVIGLAIAAKLSARFKQILVIERNQHFGEETSSRNSEVIHAGIYYPDDSLKASLCVKGKQQLYTYCQQRHIPHQKIGKLLVAHGDDDEHYLLQTIQQAERNGVNDLIWQSESMLKHTTPALSATAALLSPSTGIIDVHSYMQSLLAQAESQGALFVAQTEFINAQQSTQGFNVTLNSQNEISQLNCTYLINCAGLAASTIAKNINEMPTQCIPQVHYCRGHYFSYKGKSPFKQLIYPIPSKNGLGIHASLDISGRLKFGPDTEYISDIDYGVSLELKGKFAQAIQQYYPGLDVHKLQPDYAGIRPKLQGEADGFKDFVIQDSREHKLDGLINLFGIDSPGLTSSLAIADYVDALIPR